jgi:pilus assembly protein CpaF
MSFFKRKDTPDPEPSFQDNSTGVTQAEVANRLGRVPVPEQNIEQSFAFQTTSGHPSRLSGVGGDGLLTNSLSGLPTAAELQQFKIRVHRRFLEDAQDEIAMVSQMSRQGLTEQVRALTSSMLQEEGQALPLTMRREIVEGVVSEVVGFGPLEKLLADDDVTEIMVIHSKLIYVEKRGRLVKAEETFQDDAHVLRIIERIVSPLGRRIDESSPMVDARLPDGSRVNAIIPPLAIKGPCLTIRKFSRDPLRAEDLIRFGSITEAMSNFLRGCVAGRLNVIVSGGTGSGKTTTLNVLSSFIPSDERIVTIEDAAELQLQQEHVVTLESRPANLEGKGEITIRHLVKNSLRMRPDRIIVGECRGGEALDMLQAMNTGHDGSLTTAHANTPRDCVARLETMVLMAGTQLPVRAIREQIASAVNVIIQQSRLRDGSRKVTHITEVQGMEGDTVVLQDIFKFEQKGLDANGRVIGALKATGLRPLFLQTLISEGINLPKDIFSA